MSSPARHRRRSSAPVALVLAAWSAGFGAFGVIRAANARTADVERIEGLELVLTAQDGPAENYLLIGSDTRENADPNDPDFGGIGDVNAVSGPAIRHDHDPAPGGGRQRGLDRQPAAGSVGEHRRPWQLEPDQLGLQRRHRRARRHDHPGTRHPDQPRRRHRLQRIQGARRRGRGHRRSASSTPLGTRTPGSTSSRVATRSTASQSLQYARSRYYEEFRDGEWQTDPTSDLGRIERQQNFLQQTANATIDKLQSDPFLASKLISAASSGGADGSGPRPGGGGRNTAQGILDRAEQVPAPGHRASPGTTMAVLVLADGAEPILDYFRGVGPPPPVTP